MIHSHAFFPQKIWGISPYAGEMVYIEIMSIWGYLDDGCSPEMVKTQKHASLSSLFFFYCYIVQ